MGDQERSSGRSPVAAPSAVWQVRGQSFDLSRRTLVIGIVNVTPDSFSDGGRHLQTDSAVAGALRMAEEGADIIEIGGESTRPGRAETVDAEQELERVLPVLDEVRHRLPQIAISVDTYKGAVAREALTAGADIINDVYALRRSPEIAQLVAEKRAGLLLMHMRGEPQTMQQAPSYEDLLGEVAGYLDQQMQLACSCGVARACIALDPGIGFGKTLEHNVRILAGLRSFMGLQRPICIGVSRKGFLGVLTGGLPADQREEATLAASCAAVLNGASIVRVHNVRGARRALAVIDAIRSCG